MIKILTVTFNVIALVLFNFLLEDVTLTQQLPERVEEGKEFVVSVTIDKGSVEGFAKFQVVLPEGVSATEVESGISKFNMDGNKANFVWMTLPPEQSFTVSYKVIVEDPSIKEITVGGTFSYLDENERMTADLVPQVVYIGKEEVIVEVIPEPEVDIQRSFLVLEKNVYQIKTTINYKNVSGFAKIQDVIPTNAKVKPENSADAVFSTLNTKVKYVWMNFPEDKNKIVVTYILDLNESEDKKIGNLTGEFAYVHEGESRKMDIMNPEDTELVKTEEPEIAAVTPPKEDPKTEPKREEPKPEPVKNTPITSTPDPETGVVFKVQVMAAHKSVNTNTYFSKYYNFNEPVNMDQHEGWMKYLTGSYSTYKSARDKRVEYRRDYKFRGPFVVAYNDGKRITVQEALMITNQKWIN